MTKSRIIALLLVLGVGFLVLRPGDESSDARDPGGDPESTTDQQFQPREPAFPEPQPGYGLADRSRVQEAPPSYGSPGTYPPQPYAQSYSGAYGTREPYGGYGEQDPARMNGYRFRPLNEREQRRTQAPYPEQYQPPTYPAPAARQQPLAPSPYGAPSTPPHPQQDIYSFRPVEKSRASRGRWEGPYQQPGWRDDRSPLDPWTAPPNPQWGSTPPAQRMYPSYYRDTSRRITAR